MSFAFECSDFFAKSENIYLEALFSESSTTVLALKKLKKDSVNDPELYLNNQVWNEYHSSAIMLKEQLEKEWQDRS